MNIHLIIDTIHERRAGIDMIAAGYVEKTHYADPDADREGQGDMEDRGGGIPGSVRGG
jgi:hypothetical protein